MTHDANNCATPGRGTPIRTLNLEPSEFIVLTTARYFFASFAHPEGHGWQAALSNAMACYGDDLGPHVNVAVLSAVQTMRCSRHSVFRFNSAGCPRCSAYLTDHERLFLNAFRSAKRKGEGGGHALILCEGNDCSAFKRALRVLHDVIEMHSKEPTKIPTSA